MNTHLVNGASGAGADSNPAPGATAGIITGGRLICDWRADLLASRDVEEREKQYFKFHHDWFERWRLDLGLGAGRASRRRPQQSAIESVR